MDAVQLVKKDHDRVEELFVRFKGGGGLTGIVRRMTGNVPARQRRTALAGICDELDAHAHIEEEILYPAIRATGDPDLAGQLDEALKEHAGVKDHVAWIRAHFDDDEVDARVGQLKSDVEHHVSEEENEMLPRVEELIPEAERVALGRRMQARKRELLGRARPAAAPPRKTAARKQTARKAVAAPRRARKASKVRRTRAKSRKRA